MYYISLAVIYFFILLLIIYNIKNKKNINLNYSSIAFDRIDLQ